MIWHTRVSLDVEFNAETKEEAENIATYISYPRELTIDVGWDDSTHHVYIVGGGNDEPEADEKTTVREMVKALQLDESRIDYALPQTWVDDVYEKTGVYPAGLVVWSYEKTPDGPSYFGYPVALNKQGRSMLLRYGTCPDCHSQFRTAKHAPWCSLMETLAKTLKEP